MSIKQLPPEIQTLLLNAQRNEATEATVYKRISKRIKNQTNKAVLLQIAEDELRHYQIWKKYSWKDVKADKKMVFLYVMITHVFGLTFGLKLMERWEKSAILNYEWVKNIFPEGITIQHEEEQHEQKLLEMLDETVLHYLGSIVLGLNDALVELTGVLAGLTFGFQDSKMVAFSGLITGVAAAMSMAGSEFLSTTTEHQSGIDPRKASLFTGIAYIGTVILLLLPYFLCKNVFVALSFTLLIAISIIALFNFYSSIAQWHSFKKRFLQMISISLGVAFISFCVGLIVKQVFWI